MMTCGLSKSLGLSSFLKMKQQGIVTILGDGGGSSSPSTTRSLKRTFSADLSTKNWFSPMKKISSSEKLCSNEFDIWTKIQEDKNKEEMPEQSDVWSSILSSKKSNDGDTLAPPPPPYVHPLMKRASSLSEKSLKICTESLGSETGCESFSSSETETEEMTLFLNVVETEEEETEFEIKVEKEEPIKVLDQTTFEEDLPRGSFPPPIRSLSSQSLQMKTRRDNGRLVLEAVSVPCQNNFSANRQNGRLLLTFADIKDNKVNISGEEDEEIDSEEEDEEEKHNGLLYKVCQKPIGPITVHRLAHKPISIPKQNSHPTDEYNKPTMTSVVHSLPPRLRVAQLARSIKPPSTVDDTVGAACFNTCDYYWKPANAEALGPNTKFQAQNIVNKSINVGLDGWMNGCKEQRRSLLSLESLCIATS